MNNCDITAAAHCDKRIANVHTVTKQQLQELRYVSVGQLLDIVACLALYACNQ
jgi:hypothetical protein